MRKARETIREGRQSAFVVLDLECIRRRYAIWQREMPLVRPFYAVKCNPNPRIVSLLAEMGSGFDAASLPEIHAVLDADVDPSNIIYANPVKERSHLVGARALGVDFTVFDGADELEKIAFCNPGARLLIRLLPDDSSARCRLGMKYGSPLSAVPHLLQRAADLGLRVEGVSFHVGSGNSDPEAWGKAMRMSRRAFDIGKSVGLPDFSVLNIGGGFPSDIGSFASIAKVVRKSIRDEFTSAEGLEIIAEPGRYFTEESQTLAVNIIGRRTAQDVGSKDDGAMYYVNDGLYGSFNSVLYDHATLLDPVPLTSTGAPAAESALRQSSVWGQTCDGLDCVMPTVNLPSMRVGDWLLFKSMGSYTTAAASEFNGFPTPGFVYISENSGR